MWARRPENSFLWKGVDKFDISIFDIRLQQWHHVADRPDPNQNEKVAARGLLKHVLRGSLILADQGYFGFDKTLVTVPPRRALTEA